MRRLALFCSLAMGVPLAAAAPAAAQQPPPCDPESAPSAELIVPERLAYGRVGHARLADLPGLAIVERAQIQVGDHPPVVVRGLGATARRVAFRLELDEAPVPVRLTAIERRLPSAAACERTVERRVRGFRRIAVPSGCQSAKVRPRRLDMCTVDYGWSIRRLTWRRWNRDTARGRGIWNTGCLPLPGRYSCPPLRRARFTLSAIRWCHTLDSYVYTRLRVRPRGEPARTEELTCPANDYGELSAVPN